MSGLLLPLTISALVALALAGEQQQCARQAPKQTTQMVLSADHELVVRCAGGDQGSADQFPLNFGVLVGKFVDVSTRGKDIWGIRTDGPFDVMFHYNSGQWRSLFGPSASSIAAGADGTAWHVNKKDEIYRYNLTKKGWDRIPGALVQVSALTKDLAIGVNRQKELYFWKNNTWERYPRGPDNLPDGATWASIGQNDEAWAVGAGGYLWRYDPKDHKFKKQTQAAVSVDVFGPDRVVAVTKDNHMLKWDSKANAWKQLAEKTGKRASVGDNVILTLDAAGVLSAHGL